MGDDYADFRRAAGDEPINRERQLVSGQAGAAWKTMRVGFGTCDTDHFMLTP